MAFCTFLFLRAIISPEPKNSETPEARDARLKMLRENQRVRTESETSEERDRRLNSLQNNERGQRDNETSEERDRRLKRLQNNERAQRERETSQERQKRLCKMQENVEHKGRMKHLSKENRGCTNSCNSHSCTDECISTLYRTRTHHTLLKYLANLRSHVQSPCTAHHQAHFRIL